MLTAKVILRALPDRGRLAGNEREARKAFFDKPTKGFHTCGRDARDPVS